MARRSELIALGAGALLVVASPAWAADALLKEKLAPEIQARCKPLASGSGAPAGANGALSAADLGEAIQASETIPLSLPLGASSPEAVAAAAFAPSPSGPNAASYVRLKFLVKTSIDPASPLAGRYLPLSDGGFAIGRGGRPATDADAQAALVAILSGEAGDFTFYCGAVASTDDEDDAPPARTMTWTIANGPDDFGLRGDDRTYAEAAFTNDREADERSYSFNGAVGLSWAESDVRLGDMTVRRRPSAFVQVQREASKSGDSVNNLNFGAQVAGYFHPRGERFHYYSLSGRYLTDDSFDSRAWSVTARFSPDLGLPGSTALTGENPTFRWNVDLVADWFEVDNAGDKVKLATRPRFQRLGADFNAKVAWRLGEGSAAPRLVFGVEYEFREDLSDHDASADMFSSSLMYQPNDNWQAGIVYKRGENLDSLEDIDKVQLSIGVRL